MSTTTTMSTTTNATAAKSAALRAPRKRPAPSARDQELYLKYRTSGLTQAELATEYKLTQCRVSQIVRRVEAWRSKPQLHERSPGGSLREQQRLDRWLERERSEAILKDALRQFRQPQQVKSVKTGPQGEETTVRELPPNVQYLKIAQRANEQLFRREALESVPVGEPDSQERQQIMLQELKRLHAAAQQAGHITSRSKAFFFVSTLLRVLQGEEPYLGHDDPGLEELADRLLCQRREKEAQQEQQRQRHEAAETEALAESPGNGEDTLSFEPHDQPPPEDANSSSYPAPEEMPQSIFRVQLMAKVVELKNAEAVPGQGASSKSNELSAAGQPAPKPRRNPPSAPPPDAAERRWQHQEKLRQWEIARRRGLPCMFHFDPADGPLPPRYVQLDGAPCEPG